MNKTPKQCPIYNIPVHTKVTDVYCTIVVEVSSERFIAYEGILNSFRHNNRIKKSDYWFNI
jgi:hypothetical protein